VISATIIELQTQHHPSLDVHVISTTRAPFPPRRASEPNEREKRKKLGEGLTFSVLDDLCELLPSMADLADAYTRTSEIEKSSLGFLRTSERASGKKRKERRKVMGELGLHFLRREGREKS